MTVLDQQHTKITLSLVLVVIAAVASGVWWASNIDTRMNSQESQTTAQWQRISETGPVLEEIKEDIAFIKGRLQ